MDLTCLCHDLRQFIAAGRLLADSPTYTVADGRERLAAISRVLEAMDELVSAPLGGDERVRWFDLAGLVSECVNLTRLTSRVRIESEVPASEVVRGNPSLTRRAVLNLLTNAAAAAGPEGLVTVRLLTESDESWVEVLDTGEGYANAGSISGHGMSVVDAAMRVARGKLEIASEPGSGTMVRLRIPAGRRPA